MLDSCCSPGAHPKRRPHYGWAIRRTDEGVMGGEHPHYSNRRNTAGEQPAALVPVFGGKAMREYVRVINEWKSKRNA